MCPISSQPRYYRRPGPGDQPLAAWQDVGLRHPTTVRVSKLLAVDKQIIKRVLGTVAAGDLTQIDAALRSALGLR
ncbi:MAG: type II toxin-antitoxin system PemK/MazF family toxin [Deltaproteobacteria bacterium]|nr:type II toxin-antitoxin system PemK/MazF family toxin [Deltaproteobacteria bacterium]